MKSYFESLRPSERRLVVGVGILFFVVLNFVFVIPHFSDMGAVKFRMENAQDKLNKYQREIDQTRTYQRLVNELEAAGGASVPPEDQSLHFSTAIQSQVGRSQVAIIRNSKINTDTNSPFFLELGQSISVQGGEAQLVDFLYGLGSGSSLIRVRDLSIRPDPPRQQLMADVKLVASYQKKTPAKPAARGAASSASPSSPAAKNASLTPKRP